MARMFCQHEIGRNSSSLCADPVPGVMFREGCAEKKTLPGLRMGSTRGLFGALRPWDLRAEKGNAAAGVLFGALEKQGHLFELFSLVPNDRHLSRVRRPFGVSPWDSACDGVGGHFLG